MAHGFQFRDASGNIRLTITDSLPRIVHEQRFSATFSGSITVPDFSVNDGMFYYSPCAMKYRNSTNTIWGSFREPDNLDLATMTPGLRYFYVPNVFGLPTLSWDEPTKTMTITPANLPSNWPKLADWGQTQLEGGLVGFPFVGNNNFRPDYWVVFLQVNKRFEVT